MPKEFYTEKDIEDLVRRGVMSLEVNDNVVLTDLAYERANRLGLKLQRNSPDNPPGAPFRPYLSQPTPVTRHPKADGITSSQGLPNFSEAPRREPAGTAGQSPAQASDGQTGKSETGTPDLHARIRSAVIARLGSQVDPQLLDVIIKRVLASTGVK